MDGWVGGWMDGWMDRYIHTCIHAYIYAYIYAYKCSHRNISQLHLKMAVFFLYSCRDRLFDFRGPRESGQSGAGLLGRSGGGRHLRQSADLLEATRMGKGWKT